VAGANQNDPLDSGLDLKNSEIREKVIFKVLEDVWVRYRVDHRPVRKFIVRKDRTLVLRGKEQIVFQVSNPKSVTVKHNGQALGTMIGLHGLIKKRGILTLVLPQENADRIEIPFVGGALPETPDPGPKLEASSL
jgi:hypothetical protein